MKLSRNSLKWHLETAYWWNWCGDRIAARERVIEVANALLDEDYGKRQQEKTFEQKEEEWGKIDDYWTAQQRLDESWARAWERNFSIGGDDASSVID